MSVRVTLTAVLPDWWGADAAWDECGPEQVRALLNEDWHAFVEDAGVSLKLERATSVASLVWEGAATETPQKGPPVPLRLLMDDSELPTADDVRGILAAS